MKRFWQYNHVIRLKAFHRLILSNYSTNMEYCMTGMWEDQKEHLNEAIQGGENFNKNKLLSIVAKTDNQYAQLHITFIDCNPFSVSAFLQIGQGKLLGIIVTTNCLPQT